MDAIRSLSTFGACLLGLSAAVLCRSCSSSQEPVVAPTPPAPSVITSPPGTPTPPVTPISSDAELFTLVTQKEITSGTLNGSSAHHPLVRTSLNAPALDALQNGKLPAGTKFPNGSVIFKDVRTNSGTTVTYAVMYKNMDNRLAGNGWLWAEFNPNGSIGYSITNRGAGCTSCHSLERGPENDFVRTFERQR